MRRLYLFYILNIPFLQPDRMLAYLSVPIFLGGLIHYATKRFHTRRQTPAEQVEASNRNGLLFASGLITGEALMGILLAVPIIILKQFDISMPLLNIDDLLPFALPVGEILGTILLLGVAYWLYRIARGAKPAT